MHQTALLSLFPEKQIFDWQHQSVLSKLLEEDSTRTCLQYVCANKEEMCSLSDVKLKVAVFISSSRILKAYNIVVSLCTRELSTEGVHLMLPISAGSIFGYISFLRVCCFVKVLEKTN